MSGHETVVEGKKSSKKLIIIIVLAVLLVGGGGAGYYFFVMKKHTPEGEATHGKEGAEHKAEGEHAAKEEEHAVEEEDSGHGEAKEALFYDLTQPLTVNFPRTGGFSLIQVALSFSINSEETAALLKTHEPMVRNNLMMKINAQNPDTLKSREGKEALRAIVLEEVNKIMEKMGSKKNKVKEAFITSLVMQ